jgi:prophage tail gpP-like protein
MVIDGRTWAHWDDLELHMGFDTNHSVGFAAPFDVERKSFRQTLQPCSLKPLRLTIGTEPLFTGILQDVQPDSDPDSNVVKCGAYSKPAGLEYTNLPADQVPFEANGLSLAQIATRLAGLIGVTVVIQADVGGAFKRVKTRQKKTDSRLDHDQKLDDFLVELAKQRGVVRTSDRQGQLVLWRPVSTGRPVARLIEGTPGVGAIHPTINAQEYYSEITGFTTTKRGDPGAKFTERNARLSGGTLRALSFKLDDVEKGDGPNAVKAKLGRMFANAVSYVIELPSWRMPSGELWEPNTTATVLAPRAMIYRETEFFIRDVYLKQNNEQQTASLGLVLPGAFSGEAPPFMPWEEP